MPQSLGNQANKWNSASWINQQNIRENWKHTNDLLTIQYTFISLFIPLKCIRVKNNGQEFFIPIFSYNIRKMLWCKNFNSSFFVISVKCQAMKTLFPLVLDRFGCWLTSNRLLFGSTNFLFTQSGESDDSWTFSMNGIKPHERGRLPMHF